MYISEKPVALQPHFPTFVTVDESIFDHDCSPIQGGILLRFRLALTQVLEGLAITRCMCSRYAEDVARQKVLILDESGEGGLRFGISLVKEEFG